MPLDTHAARTDLTDRECAKIIGGLIGSLIQMAPHDTVRAAVRWWAETDQAWEMDTWRAAAGAMLTPPGSN